MNKREKIRMIRRALTKLEDMDDLLIDILYSIMCT